MEMNPEEQIQQMSSHLRQVLPEYEVLLNPVDRFVKIGQSPDFKDVSGEKPYSFRTETDVPVRYNFSGKSNGDSIDVGSICVIGFCRGDGTGAESERFNLSNIVIPDRYKYAVNPAKVIPREKGAKGVITELMFPLFSFDRNNGRFYDYAVHLEELTLGCFNPCDSIWITKKCFFLGATDERWYEEAMSGALTGSMPPMIYFTTGNLPTGRRFGDPHAIVYGDCRVRKEIIQVAGFLSITQIDNPLVPIIDFLTVHGNAKIPKDYE
ncbi:MAG: hypothetical protein NT001_05160 [Candidatus Woesearchaeota archaeon]|nr:hypothetical protein [Candidatus Woesearchaeota archaeon]